MASPAFFPRITTAMGFLDALFHLSGFAAPALALGLLMPWAARWVLPRPAAVRYRVQAGVVFGAGLAALVAGLVVFGRDGKMASYAALVLSAATAQWILARAWRK